MFYASKGKNIGFISPFDAPFDGYAVAYNLITLSSFIYIQ